jgi:hypothetical protein
MEGRAASASSRRAVPPRFTLDNYREVLSPRASAGPSSIR